MSQTQHNSTPMETAPIIVDGSSYQFVAPRVMSVKTGEITPVTPLVEIEITKPTAEVEYRTNESNELAHTVVETGLVNRVTLHSLADIYTNFPFLKDVSLTPGAALLHAKLVVALEGSVYQVIETTPDQLMIDSWFTQFETDKVAAYQAWLKGPTPAESELPPVATGNVDWNNLRSADFTQVIAPKQENGLLSYFVVYQNNPQSLPQQATYFPGSSPTYRHQW
jgi:hypothetical protein